MNMNYYRKKIENLQKAGKVYIMQERQETELAKWFEKHYKELSFEEIVSEWVGRYEELRDIFGFSGFPDYLVKRKGTWLRLELETFSHSYQNHPENFADIVFCIEKTNELPLETLELQEILGCEIITPREIERFLYENDEEFQREYHNKWSSAEIRFAEDTRTI